MTWRGLAGAIGASVAGALLAASAASTDHVRDLLAEDRWQEALAAATALAADEPGPASSASLGEALYRAGRIDEAGETLAPLAASPDAPPRGLAQLGLVRAAQGNDAEAAALLARAAAGAPEDPWVLLRASGGAPTRARAIELLNAYLERAAAEDPDRVEGARGTVRLYTALGERKVWASVARPERVEVPLKPMVGGGGFFIEASLANRKKIRLLLDTGSTGLFVVLRAVKKAGYTPLSEETVFAGGSTGRTQSSRGLLARFELGGLEFADALITTTSDEFDPQGRIHGVLGLNIFAGYRVTLDLARGRLVLEPAAPMPGGTPYWDVGGQMLVRAETSGGPGGLFLFDTGATRSMLDTRFAETVPGAQVVSSASVRTYGGNVAGALAVRGVTLRFLGLAGAAGTVHAADLSMRSRLGGVEVTGFLGMDLLDGTRIVVDTVARRLDVAGRGAGK
jgi:tetratricopeptide (TPR) repeat protein